MSLDSKQILRCARLCENSVHDSTGLIVVGVILNKVKDLDRRRCTIRNLIVS
jgi:hypothetical protein